MEADEEMEMLLGEIPRATSAPPHLQQVRPPAVSTSRGCAPISDSKSSRACTTSTVPARTSTYCVSPGSSSTRPDHDISVGTNVVNTNNLNPSAPPPRQYINTAQVCNTAICPLHRDNVDSMSMARTAMANLSLQQQQYCSPDRSKAAYSAAAGSSSRDFSRMSAYSALPISMSSTLHPSAACIYSEPSLQLHQSRLSLLSSSRSSNRPSLSANTSILLCNGASLQDRGAFQRPPTFVSADHSANLGGAASEKGISKAKNEALLKEHVLDRNLCWQINDASTRTNFVPYHATVGDSPALLLAPASRVAHAASALPAAASACSEDLRAIPYQLQQQKLTLSHNQGLQIQNAHSAAGLDIKDGAAEAAAGESQLRPRKYYTSVFGAAILGDLHCSAATTHDNCCKFFAQGHCIRGDACQFVHPWNYPERDASAAAVSSVRDTMVAGYKGGGMHCYLSQNRLLTQQNIQSNDNTDDVSTIRRRKDALKQTPSPSRGGDTRPVFQEGKENVNGLFGSEDHGSESFQHLMKFTNLDDLEGQIFMVAKDQHGCRYLQRKLDEAKIEDIQKIFQEIKDHVVDLMTDPFGNYLVQKLLDVCSEEHCTVILEAVTKNNDLVDISLNMHGTRAVQKLVETLQTPQQISMLISSLRNGVVTLIKDLNGNHVIQRCLQRLSSNDSQFIFDAAASHCVEIASHRHGCCVLQRCVDFASGLQRQKLVAEIARNSLSLSQDPFGNYVVQYVLELGLPWASGEIISRLEGNYSQLAMQKFSSNVVEKCLKVATEENKSRIVKELIGSSILGQLLQDPYANYVIQSALQVTKGHLHLSLVDAIKPHIHVLRASPYGKRILSRTQFKK